MADIPRRPDDEGLGPPPPLFRIGRRRTWFDEHGTLARWAVVAAIALTLFIAAGVARGVYTNLLWFDSLGYSDVYVKKLTTQLWLFFAAALLFLALLWSNLWLARAAAARFIALPPEAQSESVALTLRIGVVAASLFVAVIFGTVAASQWETVLLWMEGRSFGVNDPQFDRDIGFYMFTLPALQLLKNWLLGALIVVLLATGAVYALSVRGDGVTFQTPPRAKAHLSMLVALVLLTIAFHHWLELFHFTLRSKGAVFGAGYVDAHARVPLQYALLALSVIAAATALAGIRMRGVLLQASATGVWALSAIVVANAYPALVQRFQVEPNEIAKERKYLARDIESTRAAFALDAIDERTFPAEPTLTRATLDTNEETIRDIRLWDPRVLRDTFSQIQGLRPLYDFADVDVDRYALVGGQRRQVMLAARELSHSKLPSDASGWVNRHLQFTHGYGVVMAPVNEVTASGQPTLLLRDIPLRAAESVGTGLAIERPEIYFGEMTDAYAIVNTKEQEFDRPEGDANVYTTYQTKGGVRMGSFLRRFAYAWELADPNILISGAITGDSRLLYRRNVSERVSELAPFLQLDPDPYLVVADGRLYWMIDAYTTSKRYPYSRPHPAGYNYIRNSVKATVDAYTGDTTLYIADNADPIIATWAKVFPDLFRPLDAMPASLREHLRYPEGLFRAQAEMYRRYHMRDPQVFYNQEDLWNIPSEKFGDADVLVQPYYVTLRLPGFDRPEFVLILPFSAANRDNALSLLAARSDGANYGKTLALRFPTADLVPGPRQIEARIDQDSLVSEQLTLWNQAGSQVIRGNLLMVPIGSSYLYIEPIYLRAASLPFPELRRVVVVANGRVAMEPTLEAALAVIFGERPPTRPEDAGSATPTPAASPTPRVSPTPAVTGTPAVSPTAVALPADVANLARVASEAYDRAQERLRQGDLAGYERELKEVERALRRLVEITGR